MVKPEWTHLAWALIEKNGMRGIALNQISTSLLFRIINAS